MRHPNSKYLSLDEQMAKYLGRSKLIQIIKGKPNSKGLKYYCLCDPDTGYLYAAILHSSTPFPHQTVWGRIVAICYKLLEGDRDKGLTSYLDQGFWIFTDRYYTTVQMNYAMCKRMTYFLGTLRKCQRPDLPTEIMPPVRGKKMPPFLKDLKRGESVWMYSSAGNIAACTWKDNSLVTFLTSQDCEYDFAVVNRRCKSTAGNYVKRMVPQPDVAKKYSKWMGGVDKLDHKIQSRKRHNQSTRWYLSGVFLQALDWTCTNAGILYQDFHPEEKAANKSVKATLAYSLRNFSLRMRGLDEVSDTEKCEDSKNINDDEICQNSPNKTVDNLPVDVNVLPTPSSD